MIMASWKMGRESDLFGTSKRSSLRLKRNQIMKTTTLPIDHQWKQGEREETEQDRHSFCCLHRWVFSWTEQCDDGEGDDDSLAADYGFRASSTSELFQKRVTIGTVLAVGLVVSTTLVGSRPKTFSSPSSTTPSSTSLSPSASSSTPSSWPSSTTAWARSWSTSLIWETKCSPPFSLWKQFSNWPR